MNRTDLKEKKTHGITGFPVGIYNNSYNAQANALLFPVHYHEELEFTLQISGETKIQIDDEVILLKEGEGVFINSGQLHSITKETNKDCYFLSIVFSPKFIASEYEKLYEEYIRKIINCEISVPVTLKQEIKNLMLETNKYYQKKEYGYELFVESNLTRILAICIQNSTPNPVVKKDTKSAIIKDILNYIHSNYDKEISLEDISKNVHISKEYLCRIFKSVSVLSPIVYLNRYRITKSSHMLKNTDKGISEISSLCGFNSSSYYNKQFLRFMGCTPSEYRKREANGQQDDFSSTTAAAKEA